MSIREKLKSEMDNVPNEVLSELYDFIKFIEYKTSNLGLVQESQKLSEIKFQKVWDNDEDAIYDTL